MSNRNETGHDHTNEDPITGAPGAHPIGTGVGAAVAGAAAGAAACDALSIRRRWCAGSFHAAIASGSREPIEARDATSGDAHRVAIEVAGCP